jgi:hypothetical protein
MPTHSAFLPVNVYKLKYVKALILLVIAYEGEPLVLHCEGRNGLKVVENKVLWRVFGPNREVVAGGWRKLVMRNFIICTLRPHVIRMIK